MPRREKRPIEKLIIHVQLPDVRALKWEVTHYDRERQAPGYWFVAPYGQIFPEQPTKKFRQYQVGPYIFDNDGVCYFFLWLRGAKEPKCSDVDKYSIDAYLGRVQIVR